MSILDSNDDSRELVDKLNLKKKRERSLELISEARKKYGDSLVVANSLGKDSVVVWDLAKRVDKKIRGFVVTTRYKPKQTIAFMKMMVAKYPELRVFSNDVELPDDLHRTGSDRCCRLLKVVPTRNAIEEMKVKCWVTGIRYTEGVTRASLSEVEERDVGLIKLNPILIWKEREIWQYLALYNVEVNPLYKEGYRSLGCEPCTTVSIGEDERAGRWSGTEKCGGECGIHTQPLKTAE